MERDTPSFKTLLGEHDHRIFRLETLVERLDADMQEQTRILGEVRDTVVALRSIAAAGVVLVGLIGTVVGIVTAMA
ncbi:MAG: hypothetical protein HUU29_12020 [Planctomycetaceae bacterium]|nr:hypothetical protein [Planctomycetaceae bacterium]